MILFMYSCSWTVLPGKHGTSRGASGSDACTMRSGIGKQAWVAMLDDQNG